MRKLLGRIICFLLLGCDLIDVEGSYSAIDIDGWWEMKTVICKRCGKKYDVNRIKGNNGRYYHWTS